MPSKTAVVVAAFNAYRRLASHQEVSGHAEQVLRQLHQIFVRAGIPVEDEPGRMTAKDRGWIDLATTLTYKRWRTWMDRLNFTEGPRPNSFCPPGIEGLCVRLAPQGDGIEVFVI